MATQYVATDGNDGNPGTLASPYRTITRATTAATAGDTIIVKGDPSGVAVYDETVVFKAGVHYLGDATYQPVLDSNYTKEAAFSNLGGPANVTIENFEVRRFIKFGVLGYGIAPGTYQHNNVIKDCHIHHIVGRRSVTNEYSYGCYLAYGNWTVEGCEIHHVNGWNESTGIWFGYCKNHVADGNTIYSVRKEGIRSYYGNLGTMTNNRVFLCWIGLEANEDAQSLIINNYVSHCTGGMNPKHTNDPAEVLGYWGLADDGALKYARFWQNTVHRCTWAHLVHAINLPGYTHKSDVRNNIFSGKGGAFFWDAPGSRQAPNIVDYNVYSTGSYGPGSGTSPIYMTGYDPNAGLKTLAQLQADVDGFEANGQQMDPQLIDPDLGDLDYLDTSPAHNAGVNLLDDGSVYASQMGARGLPASRVRYVPYTVTRYASSSPYGFSLVDENMFNGDQVMPLGTWVAVDLGSSKPINHVFGDNLSHMYPGNPKRIKIDVSDGSTGPWTTVLDDEIYDAGGTSWKFELDPAVTARYVKVWFLTSQGSDTVSYFDMQFGFLEPDPAYSAANPIAVSTLTDDFNDETIDPEKWASSVNAEETGGRMRLHAVGSAFASLTSVGGGAAVSPFTLRNSSVAACMVQVASGLGDQSSLRVASQVDPAHCKIEFWVDQLHLRAQYMQTAWSTVIVQSALFDPLVHVWWRVSESGGAVSFETSADGLSWTQFASFLWLDSGWPLENLDDVIVQFTSGNFLGTANRPDFVIDQFNLNPDETTPVAEPPPELPFVKLNVMILDPETENYQSGFVDATALFQDLVTRDLTP